jgi:hypothetical protein
MIIILAYTENIEEMSNISFNTILPYCVKNNIKLNRIKLENLERPPSWYKIKLILEEFSNGEEVVMWIDSDTLLVNQNFNLHNLIDNDSLIYLSEDFNGFNCGVMIWKNHEKTIGILNKIWSMTEYLHSNIWEQGAFIELYNNDYNNLRSITKKVPQGILNAYDYRLYSFDKKDGQVTKDSFIFHLPGLHYDLKLNIMKNYVI